MSDRSEFIKAVAAVAWPRIAEGMPPAQAIERAVIVIHNMSEPEDKNIEGVVREYLNGGEL